MKKSAFLAAAVSGMMLGLGGVASADSKPISTSDVEVEQTLTMCGYVQPKQVMGDPPKADPKKDAGKHACKGKNECKGQGGCKTDKNACKGKGFLMVSEEECEQLKAEGEDDGQG